MKPNIMVIGNRKEDTTREPVNEAAVKEAAFQGSAIPGPDMQQPEVRGSAIPGPDMQQPGVQGPAIPGPDGQHPAERGSAAQEPAIQEPSGRKPFYEKDWGNERAVLSRLDGKLLADRRLYARVLYMHKIWCSTLLESFDSEPTLLMEPLELIVVDLSVGGIGVICEHEVLVGSILSFKLPLDNIEYEIKCEVVYCFENSGKYRAGLKLADRNRYFIRHLKIFVARLTLQNMLGAEN